MEIKEPTSILPYYIAKMYFNGRVYFEIAKTRKTAVRKCVRNFQKATGSGMYLVSK